MFNLSTDCNCITKHQRHFYTNDIHVTTILKVSKDLKIPIFQFLSKGIGIADLPISAIYAWFALRPCLPESLQKVPMHYTY